MYEQGLLNSLGIKTPLSNIRLFGDILFQFVKCNDLLVVISIK